MTSMFRERFLSFRCTRDQQDSNPWPLDNEKSKQHHTPSLECRTVVSQCDIPGLSCLIKFCDWAHRDLNSFPCLTVSCGKVHYNSILAP